MSESTAKLHRIQPGKDRAKAVRRELIRVLRRSLRGQGDELAGFALVLWDARGEPDTGYLTQAGPIGRGLMPTYVKDVLSRHVTGEVVSQFLEEGDEPPEGA